jgi:hypothetical protein
MPLLVEGGGVMRSTKTPFEKEAATAPREATRRRWRRALRAGGLAVSALALALLSLPPSRAQTSKRWTDGEILNAHDLNQAFDDLLAQIAALREAASTLLSLDPSDARQDDLRWALLHAAAVGACASDSANVVTSVVVPRTPGAHCTDICEAVYEAADTDLPVRLECFGAVSVGQISTRRVAADVSVGYGRRDSCAEAEDDPDPNAFDEAVIEPAEVRDRLLNGYAQYCCCGDATVRPAPETCSGDC